MLSGAADAQRAIIFVHGWGGSPVETWHHFQQLVQGGSGETWSTWWDTSDLYFYSFESSRFGVDEHIGKFLRLVDQVFPRPIIVSLQEDYPSLTPEYKELYLVAHSLGAVVVRGAVLDRADKAISARSSEQSTTLLSAKLRLFAPAMLGIELSSWLGFAVYMLQQIPGLGSWVSAALKSDTIIRQLNPGSRLITNLQTRTEELARRTPYPAMSADVVFGEDESFVERGKYAPDEIADPISEKDHQSVCKPDIHYRDPIHFVVNGAHYVQRHVAR